MRLAIAGTVGEERAGNLLGCQAAHFTQRERDPGVGRQRGMAACEDQSQPVILDRRLIPFKRIDCRSFNFGRR